MDDELVTIAKYNDSAQAELARQMLADYDIQAVVAGQHTANIYSGLESFAVTELQCLQSQAQQALEILKYNETGQIDNSQGK